MSTFRELLESYKIYHNSFSSAIQEAENFAVKKGYTLDKEEMTDKIGLGDPKPKEGETNKYSLTLYKNGKPQRKMLHIQVYNRGTSSKEFELNTYIN